MGKGAWRRQPPFLMTNPLMHLETPFSFWYSNSNILSITKIKRIRKISFMWIELCSTSMFFFLVFFFYICNFFEEMNWKLRFLTNQTKIGVAVSRKRKLCPVAGEGEGVTLSRGLTGKWKRKRGFEWEGLSHLFDFFFSKIFIF